VVPEPGRRAPVPVPVQAGRPEQEPALVHPEQVALVRQAGVAVLQGPARLELVPAHRAVAAEGRTEPASLPRPCPPRRCRCPARR